jgi:hypothetical protein
MYLLKYLDMYLATTSFYPSPDDDLILLLEYLHSVIKTRCICINDTVTNEGLVKGNGSKLVQFDELCVDGLWAAERKKGDGLRNPNAMIRLE